MADLSAQDHQQCPLDQQRLSELFKTPDLNIQQAVIALIQYLKDHQVAFGLHKSASSLSPASELDKILTHLENPNDCTFNYDPYRQLSQHITQKSPDRIIWQDVLNLIAKMTTKPTPTPVAPHRSASASQQSSKQTPYSYSTGGFESTSESKDGVDPVLNSELEPSLRFEIPDLIDAVFGHIPHLEELARTAFKSCQEGYSV